MLLDERAQVIGCSLYRNDLIRKFNKAISECESDSLPAKENFGALPPARDFIFLNGPFLQLLSNPGKVVSREIQRGFPRTATRDGDSDRTLGTDPENVTPGLPIRKQANIHFSAVDQQNIRFPWLRLGRAQKEIELHDRELSSHEHKYNDVRGKEFFRPDEAPAASRFLRESSFEDRYWITRRSAGANRNGCLGGRKILQNKSCIRFRNRHSQRPVR
jgi:hypothetical protein